ncbi:YqhG family protein [Ornithinibacillus salinisoli]|uniref:YqhG family protein n=1 Tax=Ornithinibacillus salinisoli TaxID=1848459 RepID=A0ABW4W4F5_9BACI
MAISNLNIFLQDYFTAHHCNILSNENGVMNIQLTEDMDRALMNRPFYWHYIKKMGHPGDPMKLTLITNPEKKDEKGDRIHFGSPRLQQILNHLKENEKYTKLFQSIHATKNTALHPWLVMNIKISYIGKQKKDEIFSLGLNLVNGVMKANMMEQLKKIDLQSAISDYCYTISPLIKVQSGFNRMKAVLDDYIHNQEHQWATDSLHELEKEVELLKHFYHGKTDQEEKQIQKEIDEISERYSPKITVSVINGGLFYLIPSFSNADA